MGHLQFVLSVFPCQLGDNHVNQWLNITAVKDRLSQSYLWIS